MKPPPFEYHDPDSLAAALALLAEHGDGAKILAGGQSLVPLLNFRLARPEVLIDINRLADLGGIAAVESGLRIGALARHTEVERSALVREKCPILAAAVPWIGHRQIRNRGTFGGSLAHADPAAELPLIATLLEAEIRTVLPGGSATYRPAAFFQSYLTTALAPDELITEIVLPAGPAGAGWGFREMSRRPGDFALVAVAALVEVDPSGTVTRLRLALGGVEAVPKRLPAVEAWAIGRELGAADWAELTDLVRSAVDPDADLHASTETRRDLAGTLARRVVADALGRTGRHAG